MSALNLYHYKAEVLSVYDGDTMTLMVDQGMKHFNRTALETSMDGDFDTGNVRYKARERYSFGVSVPLGIYGSPGTS